VSIGTTEIYTHVSIVKLKQIQEMPRPTLHPKQVEGGEPEATEEELLATLEAESDNEE
jgi:integrase/recombinase XerD